jgi:hypothetical protein
MLVPNHTQRRKRFCMSLMVCIVSYIVYMTKLSCSRGRRITDNVLACAKMIVFLYRLQQARHTKCKQRLPKSNLVLAQWAMRLVLLLERDPYTRDFYETNFHWLCWYDDVRAIMAASMNQLIDVNICRISKIFGLDLPKSISFSSAFNCD